MATYKLWHEYWPHLTRASKFTLGDKIDYIFVETLELIFTASYLNPDQKLVYLQKAIGKFDALKFLFQVLWEIKSLDDKKYVVLSEQLNEIGRMLGGWHKQVIRQTQTPQ